MRVSIYAWRMKQLVSTLLVGLMAVGPIAGTMACGGKTTVEGGGGSGGTGTGGTGTGSTSSGSGGGTGTGGVGGAWGTMSVVHLQQGGDFGYEQLSLSAAFYAVDFDPEAQIWGYVDTVTTPDGVLCDLYYQSGGGGGGEPPPPPPPQIDAGQLSAGAAGDLLSIAFDGQQYEVDWRSPTDPSHPMPGWLGTEALTLTFSAAGNAGVSSFQQDVELPAAATILAPTPDQSPVPQQPDGTYLIAWQPSGAAETLVILQFNLDWDNSLFRCQPTAGVTQLSLPHEWVAQFSWGYGELMIEARSDATATAALTQAHLRPARVHQQSVYFEVF